MALKLKTRNEKKLRSKWSGSFFFSFYFFFFATKRTFSKLNTVPVKIHFKFINIVPSCYWSKSGVCNDVKAHLIKLSSKNLSVNWKWVPFTSLFFCFPFYYKRKMVLKVNFSAFFSSSLYKTPTLNHRIVHIPLARKIIFDLLNCHELKTAIVVFMWTATEGRIIVP